MKGRTKSQQDMCCVHDIELLAFTATAAGLLHKQKNHDLKRQRCPLETSWNASEWRR
jgi:hypothetical protein